MEKEILVLSANECKEVIGGGWPSYILGYILSAIDNNVEGKDETRYGGQYLESIGGHSSIM